MILPLVGLFWVGGSLVSRAFAYNYTDYLMDDSTMRNAYTMTATNILTFLQQKNSGLANFTDTYICGYPSDTFFNFNNQAYDCSVAKKDNNGNTYYQTQPQSAALIIAEAAQAYGINPQAILATMQKEQSLVTTPNPVASQLNFAMGFGCPDSGSCSHSGFFNQIDLGTFQFRLNMELMSGNSYLGFAASSYACGGATRYYSTGLKPGNDVSFKDDKGTVYTHFVLPNTSTSSLYCYTPHVFPGSSSQYYSGSYWFVYYFSQWFGSNTAPYAFQGSGSSTIYFYVNGYKVVVPAMGILQDYGVNPQAIHTLDQSTVNSIPVPSVSNNGISPALGYIVKSSSDSDADGGSLYLVTIAKKYAFKTMTQYYDMGFKDSDITYMPLSLIQMLGGTSQVSNFVSSPYGSIFQVTSGQKRLIFDYQTYIGLNPSDQVVPSSYYTIGLFPSGAPLSNRDILVKYSNSEAVYLFDNNNYYSIPTFDVYNCWGFDGSLGTPTFRLPDNTYISSISTTYPLGCMVNDGSALTLLNRNNRYSLPTGYGLNRTQVDSADIVALANRLPAAGAPLKQYIKANNDAGIWYLNGGVRRPVPTYANYLLLGLSSSRIDTVDSSVMSSIPVSGLKLGDGKVVKTDNNPAVYAIEGNSRVLFTTSDDFLAFRNDWSDIETYPAVTLDADYPYNDVSVGRYFFDSSNGKTFLADANGCYQLTSSQITSYGNPTTQSYSFAHFNEGNCASGSLYVKQKGASAVYIIDSGKKRLFTTWSSLVANSGTTTPYILELSSTSINSFPSGADMN